MTNSVKIKSTLWKKKFLFFDVLWIVAYFISTPTTLKAMFRYRFDGNIMLPTQSCTLTMLSQHKFLTKYSLLETSFPSGIFGSSTRTLCGVVCCPCMQSSDITMYRTMSNSLSLHANCPKAWLQRAVHQKCDGTKSFFQIKQKA